MPEDGAYCHPQKPNFQISVPDLTALLIALEIADGIPDPMERYQAFFAIALGFEVEYSRALNIYALFCGSAV